MPGDVVKVLHQAGIMVDANIFENIDHMPGLFLGRYEGRPEFEEEFFQIKTSEK